MFFALDFTASDDSPDLSLRRKTARFPHNILIHVASPCTRSKKMDVDRWDGFRNYYELLMKQKLTRSEIGHKIVERYHVGVSTTYRHLKNLTSD